MKARFRGMRHSLYNNCAVAAASVAAHPKEVEGEGEGKAENYPRRSTVNYQADCGTASLSLLGAVAYRSATLSATRLQALSICVPHGESLWWPLASCICNLCQSSCARIHYENINTRCANQVIIIRDVLHNYRWDIYIYIYISVYVCMKMGWDLPFRVGLYGSVSMLKYFDLWIAREMPLTAFSTPIYVVVKLCEKFEILISK